MAASKKLCALNIYYGKTEEKHFISGQNIHTQTYARFFVHHMAQ